MNGHRAQIGWGVAILDVPIKHLYASMKNHVYYTAVSFGKVVVERLVVTEEDDLPLPIVSDRGG